MPFSFNQKKLNQWTTLWITQDPEGSYHLMRGWLVLQRFRRVGTGTWCVFWSVRGVPAWHDRLRTTLEVFLIPSTSGTKEVAAQAHDPQHVVHADSTFYNWELWSFLEAWVRLCGSMDRSGRCGSRGLSSLESMVRTVAWSRCCAWSCSMLLQVLNGAAGGLVGCACSPILALDPLRGQPCWRAFTCLWSRDKNNSAPKPWLSTIATWMICKVRRDMLVVTITNLARRSHGPWRN